MPWELFIPVTGTLYLLINRWKEMIYFLIKSGSFVVMVVYVR
jgi:hypothetical protein